MCIPKYFANVPADLALASVLSLRQSKIFDTAFTTTTKQDGPAYILTGKIYEFSVDETMVTYCCSVFGSLFWHAGFPAGSSTNRIGVGLSLADNETGKVVWEKNFYEERSQVIGLYYNSTRELGMFPEIYGDMMAQAADEIEVAVRNYESKKSASAKQ